jgi:hypothetical protein
VALATKPKSSAEVKERVQLHLYSSLGLHGEINLLAPVLGHNSIIGSLQKNRRLYMAELDVTDNKGICSVRNQQNATKL